MMLNLKLPNEDRVWRFKVKADNVAAWRGKDRQDRPVLYHQLVRRIIRLHSFHPSKVRYLSKLGI